MARVSRSFPTGVVEGFYGKPWTHSDRLRMLKFLGENGFNTYVFAPKEDPHLRVRWRRKYPRGYLARLHELIQAANRFSVDFVFTLSPGLDLVYSSKSERRLLLDNLRAVTDLGCHWIGILLDDVNTELTNADDRTTFTSLGEAHVSLLSEALDDLNIGGKTRLVFCPTYYANEYLGKSVSENEYLEEIGEGLDPQIDVFWTGRHVVSTTITERDVIAFEEAVKRKPLLWDNYPVNDYYRSGFSGFCRPRLNMGPFCGRAPGILKHLAGYVSNPMNESEASKVPLLTLSNYLDDPAKYSPDKAFRRAIKSLFPRETNRDEIELLVECSRANPLDPNEVEDLAKPVKGVIESTDESALAGSSAVMAAKLRSYLVLRKRLSGSERNQRFISDFKPVLAKVEKLATLGLGCLELAEKTKKGSRLDEIRGLKEKVREEMALVREDKVQALGEVAFELETNGDVTGKADVNRLWGMGLPQIQKESPVVELYYWSQKISGQASI